MNTTETPLPSVTLRCTLGKVRFTWDAPADIVRVVYKTPMGAVPYLYFDNTEWTGRLDHGDMKVMGLERGRMLWGILRRGGWEVVANDPV
jgi:hypothetical protein